MDVRRLVLYLFVVTAIAVSLSLVGNDGEVVATPAQQPVVSAVLPDLAGDWSGTWHDTVYDVSGLMSITITDEGNGDWSAAGVIDLISLGSGFLGGSATASGDADAISGTFSCSGLGSGTFSISSLLAAGAARSTTGNGSGTVVAPLDFGPFTFVGNVTDTQMSGIFDFTNPGGGGGNAVLNKEGTDPVVEKTWGALKNTYRD